MELRSIVTRLKETFHKFRYVILVIAIGILFMVIPDKPKTAEVTKPQEEVKQTETIESRLASILSEVDGAGQTNVLLTVLSGEETIYQIDEQISANADSSETKITTITITGKDKNETGLIRQVIPQKYLGAIIVCQGADSPSVKLAIVEAVGKVTGLGADQISVLKMK